MATAAVQTISISIERPFAFVYEFLAVPENFPRWASGLASGLNQVNGEWIAQTPDGPLQIRFTPRNVFGIADHYVVPKSGPPIYIPMRVIANRTGSEVIFTLFRQPDMSDEKFAADAAWVRRDLQALKELLEAD